MFLLISIVCSSLLALSAGWIKQMETPGYYQGDIQLSPEQWERVQNRSSPFGSIRNRRWPNGKIPYAFESSLGQQGRDAVHAAIADYHKFTCLRFTPRNGESNYISFFSGNGCNSPVGMYGVNRISLGAGCLDKGTALHEIGHSIGLQHEQCRPDRDQHVIVHTKNIDGPWAYAFAISNEVDSLGTPYDLSSMMHYSSTAFARSNTKTITTKDPSKQRLIDNYNRISGFSATDIVQINKMYSCGGGEVKPVTVAPGCADIEPNCGIWLKQGYCLASDLAQRKRMHDKCCKSCTDACGKCGL
ncbi:low choriolytic enzyme isoform X3 [Hydra vulgaris]|uniref:Metalloendopeptidase n=1 Tax=Hydra vulgaris TaxID=6087 RepID=A0ABM4DNZ6_HYDVU